MRSKGELFSTTGDGLAKVTTDGWVSRAGDRFRDQFDTEPGRWRDAGADWHTAAGALEGFADDLENAQQRARWAESEHARGEQMTRDAKAAYDADVSRAQGEAARDRAAGMTVNLTIAPFQDPGEQVRQGALHELASARSDLDAAAHLCASGVKAGCSHAPAKRKWYEKVGGAVAGFFEGAGEALLDLGKLAAFLTMPEVVIPMMLMDDIGKGMTAEEIAAKYKLKLEDAGNMLSFAVQHPGEFGKTLGKAVLDWDTWKDDPARALGHLLPDAVIAVLTAGSGTVATRGAKGLADGMKGLRAVERLQDLAGVRHLDDLRGVNRFDGPPGSMSEWTSKDFRSLDDQLADPSFHGSNRDIIEGDYDVLGGRQSPAEFRDDFQRTDADGRRQWDWENAAPDGGKVPGSERMLAPGETPKLDRIGGDNGEYFGRDGDSFGSRSLPPDRLNFERNHWEVNSEHPSLQDGSVRVEQSEVAPAFGQDGGGTQYRFLDAAGNAISQGELRAGDDPLIRIAQPDGGQGLGSGAAGAGATHGAVSLDRFLEDYLPQAAGR